MQQQVSSESFFRNTYDQGKNATYCGDSPVCVKTPLLNFNFAAMNCHFLWILYIEYPELSINTCVCFNPIFKSSCTFFKDSFL